MVLLDGSHDLTIAGGGHALRRRSGQRNCSLIRASKVSNASVRDLILDDDESAEPCTPADKQCAPTVFVGNAQRVLIQNVRIYNAKQFSITVSGVDGFTLDQSALVNSGIIGIYVGKATGGIMSNHIRITDSVFARTRTNAIALDGVRGASPSDNVVSGNVFTQNHVHGLYMDPKNKPYDGGQIYIPDLTGATITQNVVGLGGCPVCDNPMVWGVEIGRIGQVNIQSNVFFRSYGAAFFKDTGGSIDSTDVFQQNSLRGLNGVSLASGGGNDVSGARMSGNVDDGHRIKLNDLDSAYRIYRVRVKARHWTVGTPEKGAVVEGVFTLSPIPRPGAPIYPIFGCGSSQSPGEPGGQEFPSTSKGCEGSQIVEVFGYPYEAAYPGAQPVYRCRDGADRFISWDAACEGKTVEAQLGYALQTEGDGSRREDEGSRHDH